MKKAFTLTEGAMHIDKNSGEGSNHPLSLTLSWICSTLTEFRNSGFATACSICSLSGLISFRPSAKPLSLGERTTDEILPSPNLGEGKGEVKNLSNEASVKNYSLLTKHFLPKTAPILTFPHRGRKYAFTLAEVLVTLGIIGVVAAMTLPTFIQNHQKQVYATSLKKAVNVLENMRIKLMADEEVTNFNDTKLIREGYCFEVDEYGAHQACGEDGYAMPSIFESELIKNFKVVKTCKNSECDTLYRSAYLFPDGEYSVENSSNTISGDGFLLGIYTTDGFIFYFHAYADNSGPNLSVDIDVNGEKGPNQWGRDFFSYIMKEKDSWGDNCLTRMRTNGWKMDY